MIKSFAALVAVTLFSQAWGEILDAPLEALQEKGFALGPGIAEPFKGEETKASLDAKKRKHIRDGHRESARKP